MKFEKTKRLTTDDLSEMAQKCKYDWEINDIEKVMVDHKEKEEEDVHENPLIPVHPFRMIVVGRSGSGKTILTLNLLVKFLKYDCLYLICTTANLQTKYDLICDLANLFPSKFKVIEDLKKFDINKINKNKKNLILCDDLNELPDNELLKITLLFSKGRHYNCSIIYLSQYFYRVGVRARGSASHFVLFVVNSEKDKRRIFRDVANDLTPDQFLKLFNEATEVCDGADKFSCFVVDNTQSKLCLRFRKNFVNLFLDNLDEQEKND